MSQATIQTPDIAQIRAHFPALAGPTVLLENAGGSQVPRCVADAMHEYLLHSYVQVEAGYEMSRRATQTVEDAHAFINLCMNGVGEGEVILGPSTSQLMSMLAQCYAPLLTEGDELVLAECGHEANVGPWARLAEHGATVRWWPIERETGRSSLDGLASVLSDRTRLVAFPHVSNLLGEIVDVAGATRLAHDAGAEVVVDGVAYAPHRAIDVTAWNVDWYAYSTYKVYGPHMAALFGRHERIAALRGPNHFFIPDHEVPYKFELGGVNHEGCAGLLALGAYLKFLAGYQEETCDREAITRAFDVMTELERPLQRRLIEYLRDKQSVRIIGPDHAEDTRVPTVSFVHDSRSSRQISDALNARGIGMRHGHMYAHRLCTGLGLEPEDGVVRVSAVHYNDDGDLNQLFEALEAVL